MLLGSGFVARSPCSLPLPFGLHHLHEPGLGTGRRAFHRRTCEGTSKVSRRAVQASVGERSEAKQDWNWLLFVRTRMPHSHPLRSGSRCVFRLTFRQPAGSSSPPATLLGALRLHDPVPRYSGAGDLRPAGACSGAPYLPYTMYNTSGVGSFPTGKNLFSPEYSNRGGNPNHTSRILATG